MIETRSLFVFFKSTKLYLHASHQLTSNNIKILLLLPFICLYTFSAINFQGYCICQVSCYTLLNRFQLHGHCPGVLIQQHFLWYLIMSVQSGTFKTRLSVHPASHILLTKKCPQIEKNIQNWNALCPSQLSHPFKV